MKEELKIIVFVIILCMGLILIAFAIYKEKKIWNKGYCPKCGEKWIMFDMDSQGGRMYKCKNNHHCVCTYNVDNEEGE